MVIRKKNKLYLNKKYGEQQKTSKEPYILGGIFFRSHSKPLILY